MKPVIGVMPSYDKNANQVFVRPGYLEGIKNAGGIPLVFPYGAKREDLEQLNQMVSGYLFTGGNDVNPALYHDEVRDARDFDDVRDAMETYCYMMARRDDKAVLGICRGIQLINVLEGGSLYQDLKKERSSRVCHLQEKPYDKPSHHVLIGHNSPLSEIIGEDVLEVNSIHHEAVKRIGSHLRSMAISEDGLVEAVYYPGKKFIWAIQWHPDFMIGNEDASSKIFKAFVDASGEEKHE